MRIETAIIIFLSAALVFICALEFCIYNATR